MAGRQLAALAPRLLDAGWKPDTPASVVSRVGWPDELHSDHDIATLGHAAVLHAGRPSVVTVGAGARPIGSGQAESAAITRTGPVPVAKP